MMFHDMMANELKKSIRLSLLEDNRKLLNLIIKYDCKPSEIAEIVRLRNYDLTNDYQIIDIKLKPKKKSIFDKVKKLCRIE